MKVFRLVPCAVFFSASPASAARLGRDAFDLLRGQLADDQDPKADDHQEPMTTTKTTTELACLESVHGRLLREIGDLHAAPALYSQALGLQGCIHPPRDFEDWRNSSGYEPLMVGGGEIPENIVDLLGHHAGPVVFWGVSVPSFDGSDRSLPMYARQENVKLVGVRDYIHKGRHQQGSKVRWVPCASAMHRQFDEHFHKKPGVGILVRKNLSSVRSAAYVKRANQESSNCGVHVANWIKNGHMTEDHILSTDNNLETLINFIAGSEAVISQSYHVLYWATLLGRKAIFCGENNEEQQLKSLKWPVVTFSGNLTHDLDAAAVYPNALQEARNANINFAKDVQRVLKLGA